MHTNGIECIQHKMIMRARAGGWLHEEVFPSHAELLKTVQCSCAAKKSLCFSTYTSKVEVLALV